MLSLQFIFLYSGISVEVDDEQLSSLIYTGIAFLELFLSQQDNEKRARHILVIFFRR